LCSIACAPGVTLAQDLATRGADLGVCPYYGARRLVSEADVVVAPYASVLHADSRQALGLSLEGAVLVLDEAHNLVGEGRDQAEVEGLFKM
jgi:chromosome transmission fidelity protein 1